MQYTMATLKSINGRIARIVIGMASEKDGEGGVDEVENANA